MTARLPAPDHDSRPTFPRRTVIQGAAIAAAAVPLAACGSSSSSNDKSPRSPGSDPSNGSPSSAGGSSSSAGGSNAAALTSTSDIPQGGGKIFDSQKVVVTQPKAGSFKCFTAVCTHQGCIVATVSGGTINCGCHGSMYNIATGAVVGGPAPAPLAPVTIDVTGNEISLA